MVSCAGSIAEDLSIHVIILTHGVEGVLSQNGSCSFRLGVVLHHAALFLLCVVLVKLVDLDCLHERIVSSKEAILDAHDASDLLVHVSLLCFLVLDLLCHTLKRFLIQLDLLAKLFLLLTLSKGEVALGRCKGAFAVIYAHALIVFHVVLDPDLTFRRFGLGINARLIVRDKLDLASLNST